MMKTYLIVACAAFALMGCARNDEHRGGMRDSSDSESGRSVEQTTPSTNSINNNGVPGSQSDKNDGVGSEK